MGFGHRVYKNYDPRATIIRETADQVFEVTGRNPLIDVATELEQIALQDDYFVSPAPLPQRGFLLRHHLPGDGLLRGHVPRPLRHPENRWLAGPMERNADGPSLPHRPSTSGLLRGRQAPLHSRWEAQGPLSSSDRPRLPNQTLPAPASLHRRAPTSGPWESPERGGPLSGGGFGGTPRNKHLGWVGGKNDALSLAPIVLTQRFAYKVQGIAKGEEPP